MLLMLHCHSISILAIPGGSRINNASSHPSGVENSLTPVFGNIPILTGAIAKSGDQRTIVTCSSFE